VFRNVTARLFMNGLQSDLSHGGQCNYTLIDCIVEIGYSIIPEVRLFLARWMSAFGFTNRKMVHDSALILRFSQKSIVKGYTGNIVERNGALDRGSRARQLCKFAVFLVIRPILVDEPSTGLNG
jgi:hypothetical protein